MEKYSTLRSAIYNLNLGPGGDIETSFAQMRFESKLRPLSGPERAQFLLDIQMDLEQALADPGIDWVKFGEEAIFVYTLPNDISWPFNYSDGVINEIKAVLYDFIYPDRIISKQDLVKIEGVVFFLLLECEKLYQDILFETILAQLRTMKPHWLNLEDFHLRIILGLDLLKITYNYAEFKKNRIKLNAKKADILSCIESYKNIPPSDLYPYPSWPPFYTDPSHPNYLKYDIESWLEILRNIEEKNRET